MIVNIDSEDPVLLAKYCIVLRECMTSVDKFKVLNLTDLEYNIFDDKVIEVCSVMKTGIISSTRGSSILLYNSSVHFSPLYSFYYKQDDYTSYINQEAIMYSTEWMPEEYWFQQMLVLDKIDYFFSRFFNTLYMYDSLKFDIHYGNMLKFIKRNKDVMDDLVQKVDWCSFEE